MEVVSGLEFPRLCCMYRRPGGLWNWTCCFVPIGPLQPDRLRVRGDGLTVIEGAKDVLIHAYRSTAWYDDPGNLEQERLSPRTNTPQQTRGRFSVADIALISRQDI